MKKCTKFLVLALAVIALTAVFSIPSSAEAKGPVLYVSSNGTGDGLTPENPMGNGEGYDRTNGKTANKNVLVRALYEFTLTGGTIVLVEPVVIDTNDSYPTETDKTPAELNVPDIRGSVAARDYGELPVITVTSNYGGVDYRKPENGGAKLVLDHTLSPSSNLRLVNSGIWKDLIIEYRYDPTRLSYYNTPDKISAPFMFEGNCEKHVFDTGIACTSVKVVTNENGEKTETEGDVFPMILGAHRQTEKKGNTEIIIRSGTWSYVSAAGYGHKEIYGQTASVKGDVKLTVEGGKIGTIYGTGSVERPYGTVDGRVDISISNAEVGDIYLTNGKEYNGAGITLTVNSTVINKENIHHSPNGDILSNVTVTVDGESYTPVPKNDKNETTPPETEDTVSANEVTATPTEKNDTQSTDDKENKSINITLIIVVAVLLAALAIGGFAFRKK